MYALHSCSLYMYDTYITCFLHDIHLYTQILIHARIPAKNSKLLWIIQYHLNLRTFQRKLCKSFSVPILSLIIQSTSLLKKLWLYRCVCVWQQFYVWHFCLIFLFGKKKKQAERNTGSRECKVWRFKACVRHFRYKLWARKKETPRAVDEPYILI